MFKLLPITLLGFCLSLNALADQSCSEKVEAIEGNTYFCKDYKAKMKVRLSPQPELDRDLLTFYFTTPSERGISHNFQNGGSIIIKRCDGDTLQLADLGAEEDYTQGKIAVKFSITAGAISMVSTSPQWATQNCELMRSVTR